ncbi:MAG: lipid transporter permease/ATP-binding protein [Clostridiales bacterium]|jgi:ABC-type multidrug transport system fused ATPase/permease subunit|nr:lipid transporter permease/ATP-binding protein [Clostridiales bacterium]
MDNINQEEAVVKEYDSKLMKRLLLFAKPFTKYFILIILLIAIVTAVKLVRPLLIKTAIDDYINGYKKPYTILTTSTPGSVKVGDKYIVRESTSSGTPASIVFKDNTYYLVDGAVNHGKSFEIENNSLIQGDKSFNVSKLTPAELKILREDDASGLLKMTILLIILMLSSFFFNYAQILLLSWTGQKIIFDIRQKVFKHVESLSLSFFDKNPVGRLVTRVTNDVETLNEMYTSVLISLISDVFIIGGVLIAMFLLNVKLGLIALVALPLVFGAAMIFKKYDRDAYRDVRTRIAKINSSLAENISGMKTVQIFAKENKKFRDFDKINKSYREASVRQITVFAVFRPAIDFFYAITLAAILWFGGVSVIQEIIPFGLLYAFINYLGELFQPIYDITEKYDILQSAMASSERIFALLDNNDRINKSEKPVVINKVEGEIEFKNVWFAYNEEEWVLRDVSFKIRPGEKIAFVGATGAGKTSIISLISRFYDIQKGEILIDGVNIKDMYMDNLRHNIATVLQDVFLFTGNIKSNIRLNDDSVSDEKIIEAARYVNADKFIEKLPDKYDSYVNERGSTFSQGERQLIAFARAIAFNPPILVLDEATSNIDTETESLIQDALEKITRDRTTIIVAHRLSTIKKADKIVVLHKGKIREMGKHEELLEKQGLYFNLYQLQYKED